MGEVVQKIENREFDEYSGLGDIADLDERHIVRVEVVQDAPSRFTRFIVENTPDWLFQYVVYYAVLTKKIEEFEKGESVEIEVSSTFLNTNSIAIRGFSAPLGKPVVPVEELEEVDSDPTQAAKGDVS